MINLITMAGRGKRFSEQGYTLPKPLIPIDGVPMIYKVIDCLPKANKWIFVVRQEHIDDYHIDKVIKRKIPDAIITVDKDLLGGASIFCAEQYIPDEEDVFIAGCDMGFIYNEKEFEKIKNDKKYDCVLWTFTKDKRITEKPESWGYAVLDKDNITIKDMSVKIPISKTPFNDHVVAATFWIRSKKLLYQGIRTMIDKKIQTNNEYYLDNLPLAFNLLNKKSRIFDVELLIGWGTPEEFHEYEKLSFFANINKLSELKLSKKENILWKKYFDSNISNQTNSTNLAPNSTLSIIIPVYNEAENIPLIIKEFEKHINKYNFKIIFAADNGSSEETVKVIKDFSKKYNFVDYVVAPEKGYGASIYYGLKSADTEFICWTHADLQTPPEDTLRALNIISKQKNPQKTYVKGKRYGRPFADNFFTFGMSVFEILLLNTIIYDINAQPNLFHKSFLELMKNPPLDFSFDLYSYYLAKKYNYNIKRFPVFFGTRIHGHSAWNFGMKSKMKFINRTIDFSFKLKKMLRRNVI